MARLSSKIVWFLCLSYLVSGFLLPLGADGLAALKKVTADRILVNKSDRRLHVIADGRVIRTYRISLGSQPVGDKIQRGDNKTPVGRYIVDWRNPDSRYHRAFHISYPNAADREDARRRGVDPGGMIMIHGLPDTADSDGDGYVGLDWTDGCIAMRNEEIDQLWELIPVGTPVEILP